MVEASQVDWVSNIPPFQPHSPTSRAAAESIADELNALQWRVLAYLRQHPDGLTDEEIQTGLGMNPNTQRPRRIELQRRGLIVTRGTRKTRSGRCAIVWRAA